MGVLLRWSAFLYSLGLWDGSGDFAEVLVTAGIDTVTRDLLREAICFCLTPGLPGPNEPIRERLNLCSSNCRARCAATGRGASNAQVTSGCFR